MLRINIALVVDWLSGANFWQLGTPLRYCTLPRACAGKVNKRYQTLRIRRGVFHIGTTSSQGIVKTAFRFVGVGYDCNSKHQASTNTTTSMYMYT
jgi:hypothetical protein